MIELANAPKPKPIPTATAPSLQGQPAIATEPETALVPTRVAAPVLARPITSFGRRS